MSGEETLTYGEALDELEDLLDELEGADVDVDVLAARVARGVELIRFCRARLEVVTSDVDAVVSELIRVEDTDEPTVGLDDEPGGEPGREPGGPDDDGAAGPKDDR